MQRNFDEAVNEVTFLIGSKENLSRIHTLPSKSPFSEEILVFLNIVAKLLLQDKEAKYYPDVITLGFWLRKANMLQLKKRYGYTFSQEMRVGKGVIIHIAPSNVAVNYAYSLFTGLVTGNSNIVRLPTKEFPQINIINRAIVKALDNNHEMEPYINLIRYGHQKDINDMLSDLADVRIIWGGDKTIEEIRKSPLKPRATEITFADRFSFCIINADEYLKCKEKEILAQGFYNDTYLTDQNACTSPKILVWLGEQTEKAKIIFWDELYKIVKEKYHYQNIQGVNKLVSMYLLASSNEDVYKEYGNDNLIIRVKIKSIDENLIDFIGDSGYFLEYDCKDILELKPLCNEKCQTLSYYSNKQYILPLLQSGVKGIDRIVPIGKTMDFDFNWDGYNLVDRMTRIISILES